MRIGLFFLLSLSSLGAQTPDSLFRARRFDEARAAYSALLAKDKNDANAMFWLGRISDIEGKQGEATDWFEKAVKRDDKNALYQFHLGASNCDEAQNASKLRQPFLAKRCKAGFERAVALDPNLIDAREGLTNYYLQAPGFMGGSKEKAAEQVAEIRKLNPLRGHLFAGRLAQDDNKDLPGAEKEYLAAIALAPDSAQAYYSLAGLYRGQQKWDEAFGAYERLMKAKPDERVVHLGWGAVSAISGKQVERGERELKLFLSTATVENVGNINLAGAHFRLGMIYEKTARKDLAKAEYNETLKINPRHADAKKALDALK